MTWNPDARVIIGSDLTNYVLIGGRVTYGQTDFHSMPRASYANLTFEDNTGTLSFALKDTCVVTMDTTTGTPTTIFTGEITDFSASYDKNGRTTWQVTAMGPLERLSLGRAGLVDYPQQPIEDRIRQIVADGVATATWILTLTGTIGSLTGTVGDIYGSAAQYLGTFRWGAVLPGGDVVARPAAETDPNQLLSYQCDAAPWYVYETADGKVNFDFSRLQSVNVNSLTVDDDGVILPYGKTFGTADVVNVVTSYDTQDPPNYDTSFSTTSMRQIGVRSIQIETNYVTLSDFDKGLVMQGRIGVGNVPTNQMSIALKQLPDAQINALLALEWLDTINSSIDDGENLRAIGWTWNLSNRYPTITIGLAEMTGY